MSTEAAREDRQDMNAQTQAEAEDRAEKYVPSETKRVERNGRQYKRVRMNGCWYLTRDFDAGIRSYSKPGKLSKGRFWHGYYSGKLVDHLTGGVIPSVDSASKQECKIFPELSDRAQEMIGEAPETITADRGVSLAECFEHATRAGTAPIFPWRVKTGEPEPADRLEYDRHGIKRCAGCGGPMQQTNSDRERAASALVPLQAQTHGCVRKEQTISCSADWRLLVPLAQTEPLYHELAESHQTYEGVHLYWRNRYRVGSDVLANRSKRVSIGCHRLRANVACLVDWLRIAARCGWLGSTAARPDTQASVSSSGTATEGREAT